MRLHRFQILDEEQKAQVASILSRYDPLLLTAKDAATIINDLFRAGLEPGDGLFEAIHRAGYDPSATQLIIPMIMACKQG